MSMRARITSRTPLLYSAGADASLDRPAHVRAGSGLALVHTARGRRLLVAQDDAAFLALVSLDEQGRPTDVEAITLPAGPGGARQLDDLPGGRGNKKHKLDLECVLVLDDGLDDDNDARGAVALAFGSGSGPARERVVLARLGNEPFDVRVVEAGALYAALRAHPLLANAELNLEGAALLPSGAGGRARTLRLFQRGNGLGAVDATFDVDARALLAHLEGKGPLPPFLDARHWDLGSIQGVRLTFTDASAHGGQIYVVAAAEASPNAWDDGVVVGGSFGVLGAPLSPILDEDGVPFVGKPEGLALDVDEGGLPRRGWIVLDKDDPHAPAELCTIALERE